MILRAKVSVVYSFKRNTHDELHVSDNLSRYQQQAAKTLQK